MFWNKFKFILQNVTKFKLYKSMNPYEADELDAFLVQAELINQKVKALAQNRMTPEEFDKIQEARAEDLRKREEGKKKRQRQAVEKKKQGREGKGITKDFMNFCRYCHRQYELPTPKCFRCNRDTMTLEQRQQQLEIMVNEYKDKKKKREQKKMKWDMWQKTKAMLWKKNSNNYNKWDYFVSESEEEPDKEPIVPKNDPNFKALEMDMEQRKKRRMNETEKAKKLKEKGNACMKEGDYQKAMEYYTLALQHIKDIKSIYTNRALAFIKLGKFKKAIADCTNVIEYMEVFQKVGENLDITFKAFSRRALAHKQRKNYKQALDDINKALNIYPTDKNGQILKKEVQGFIAHTEKVEKLLRENKKQQQQEKNEHQNQEVPVAPATEQEMIMEEKQIIKQLAEKQLSQQEKTTQTKQGVQNVEKEDQMREQKKKKVQVPKSPLEQVKFYLGDLSTENIESLIKLLRNNEDLITIFIAGKGIRKCLEQLIINQECSREGFLISRCLREDGVGEKQVWEYGIEKLHNRISDTLDSSAQLNMNKYFILEDIFEVLIPMSLHQKYRELLNQSPFVHKFIEKTYSQLISRHKKQTELFSSFLIYMSNLCSGQSSLRDKFITDQILRILLNSIYEKIILRKTSNRSYQDLKKNCYSLFANLVHSPEHRSRFNAFFGEIDESNEAPRWEELIKQLRLYLRRNENFTEYIESLLSVFVNTTLGSGVIIEGLSETLNDRFLVNPSNFSPEIIHRSLLIVSRLKYKNSTPFKRILKSLTNNFQNYKALKIDKNPMEQVVRILNILYMPIDNCPDRFSEPLPETLLTELKSYISTEQKSETLFSNTSNLFCVMLEVPFAYREVLYKQIKPLIPGLITIAKDRVSNWRKNAAILLAKLAINAECKEELRKNHGMDVLMSIAKFVK